MSERYGMEIDNHEQLTGTIPYLLAGLAGNTDGHELTSVAVQQAGVSSWRVVVRGRGLSDDGDPVCVVGFTNADNPGRALLLFERAYKENLVRWKIDRFAERVGTNDASKNGQGRLNITN